MNKRGHKVSDDFASSMQKLAAEVGSGSSATLDVSGDDGGQMAEILRIEMERLDGRVAGLERTLTSGLEKLNTALKARDNAPKEAPNPLGPLLQRVDENVTALRTTETVNQRLFDSLHSELKNYRDNFVHDALQKPFIRDLIVLFDDMTALAGNMQAALTSEKADKSEQWCANVEAAIGSVLEILHRLDVQEIERKDKVDRKFHRVASFEPAERAEDDGLIVQHLKRGFLWREQLLRPEEVIAKRFG